MNRNGKLVHGGKPHKSRKYHLDGSFKKEVEYPVFEKKLKPQRTPENATKHIKSKHDKRGSLILK